ncbi:MAG: hypothetical protein AB1700_16855 [Bacillota bacterium]
MTVVPERPDVREKGAVGSQAAEHLSRLLEAEAAFRHTGPYVGCGVLDAASSGIWPER